MQSDKQQQERDWVLGEFKSGRSPIMIATDVASRGLAGAGSPLPPELAQLAGILPAFTIFTCVWLGIYIWDTMATFPLEYRCVLRAKMSAVKAAYLVNRYWTLILLALEVVVLTGAFTPDTCSTLAFVRPVGQIVTVVACSAILAIRLWALWDRNRVIFASMLLLISAQLGVMLGIVTQGHALILPPEIADAMDFRGCLFVQKDGYGVAWATTLFFETIALSLLVYRIVVLRHRNGHSPILCILLRHGVGYFAVVFVSGLVNLIFFALADDSVGPSPPYQAFNVPATIAIMSLMSSRLVLDLHRSKKKLNLSSAGPQSCGRPTTASPLSPPLYGQHIPIARPSNPLAFSTAQPCSGGHVAIELGCFSGTTYHGDHVVPCRIDTSHKKPSSRFDDAREEGGEEDLSFPLTIAASSSLHPSTPTTPPVLSVFPCEATSFAYNATSPCTPPSAPPPAATRFPSTTYTVARPSSPTAWARRSLGRSPPSAQSGRKKDVPRSPSVEGAILVQRETTVAVSDVPVRDRESRGPGMGKGDIWTGQAL
ncbi:hypothetical protein JCM10207_005065 [Rhodosporidiobolus poonsookiae]